MVNIDDFIKKLEIILDYYGLSASAFADKVGVQRSSLSHLLSGRNKPSLDLILKIVENFPEVDLYWIINGKGNFPKSEIQNEVISVPSTPILKMETEEIKAENQPNLFSAEPSIEKNHVNENFQNNFLNREILGHHMNDDEIEKIVIFYTNGTFKSYQQKTSI